MARIAPRPDVSASIRKVAVRTADSAAGELAGDAAVADHGARGGSNTLAAVAAPLAEAGIGDTDAGTAVHRPSKAAPARPVFAPLAPDRYQIRFTASEATCEKLRLAQDLLRHAIPDGDPGEIIDRALTLLLEDVARKKAAATQPPRPQAPAAVAPAILRRTRHIPARVKRTVWLRDGGRCAFIGKGGRRCSERAFVEFHHVAPDGVGGEAAVGNIALRCRAHNGHEAVLFFGVGIAQRRTRSGTSDAAPSAGAPS